MRFNRMFIIGVLAFLVIVFIMGYRMPKKFQWLPTYSHHDKQPFGCYVFDSVLKASLLQDYRIERKTFYQLKGDTSRKAFLMVADNVEFPKTDVTAIMELARKGNVIMLVSNSLGKMADTLHLNSVNHYTPMTLTKHVQAGNGRDTLVWQQDSIYDRREFKFYPQLLLTTIVGKTDTLDYHVLCRSKSYYSDATAVQIPMSRGCIIWVSTPLVFTNYGILDKDNYHYIFRLLTQLRGLPIVRTEAYTPIAQESPLRYILEQPPLRWALYLSLLTILLFMVFTARRRQRAIPLVKGPDNMSLSFAKQIGTLYAQRKDYTDAVTKKYTYFAEELRTLLHIDITDVSADNRNLNRLAFITGIEKQQLAGLVDELRQIASGMRQIGVEDLGHYIGRMNEIIGKLKN